jgi:flavodoxin
MKNALLAYFSRTGNTRTLAKQINKIVSGDIFEIQPEIPYPSDYEETKTRAERELEAGTRPKLKAMIKDIGQYDTVFVGYPMWWGTMPMPVYTFLSGYDFSGKKIVPYCTHEGSQLGNSIEDIRKLCPDSTILEGLAVWDHDLKNDSEAITDWLRKLKMMKP